MKHILTVLAIGALGTGAALAQEAGDPAKGEAAFKQCQTCHVVQAPDGTLIAGRAGKTGPNLYGVVGRTAGTFPEFTYGDDIVAAGQKGLVWDEANFTAYVQDPSAFLKEYLADPGARGKMTYKVKKEQDAHDLWAYFVSIAPAQ
jgi:cytochrome c